MSYFNGARLRRLRELRRMSLTDVSARTGVSRAQISLIENGKVDPRMSTVVKILSCYGAGLADLESRPPDTITVDEVTARAEQGARRLAEVGLGPSDPVARLRRRADRDKNIEAEEEAMATRS